MKNPLHSTHRHGVVSRRLNRFLTNNDPPADEVTQLNNMAAYPP